MIPKLIHQLWHPFSATEIPLEWQRFARSWRRRHPEHRYELWGPDESRNFVAAEFPDFLPTYDRYSVPMKRLDALRMMLLAHFGGVYADLDVECLRPIDELLEGHDLVLVPEPARHSSGWADRGYRQVLSTAFMASTPRHPFWKDIREEQKHSAEIPDPMDSTGPFLVSRCYERFRERTSVRMLSPDTIYPIDQPSFADGTALDVEGWVRATRSAYAVHHWASTWNRPGESARPARRAYPFGLPLKMRDPQLHRERPGQLALEGPLVSCLMVSGGWREPAQWAVECFRNQSYENRELVVVTASGEGDIRGYLASLQDPRVRFAGVFPEGTSAGALRNLALDNAGGELVCTWNEDDLSGVDRIASQFTALLTTGAEAAFLERICTWWPSRRAITLSVEHLWENSLLARRRALARYREVDRGEERSLVEALRQRHSCALVSDPNLLIHTATAADDLERFEWFLQTASFTAHGQDYDRALTVLAKHAPVLPCLEWLQRKDPRTFGPPAEEPAPLRAPRQPAPPTSRIVPPPIASLHATVPPLRFLFAWELGGGLGHTVPLSQVARPLLEAGHEVHMALADLSSARAGLGALARHPRLRVWQAPAWISMVPGMQEPACYADLLMRAGYLDANRLAGLVDGWESIVRTIDPDLLLVDHAPTSMLAARGHRFKRATSGTGFFHPLPESPIPTFRDWESIPAGRLVEAERTVLETCNTVLAARHQPLLSALHELVAADEHFLLTVPELDHFAARGNDPAQRYYGSLPPANQGRPAMWPRGTGPALFAYVKAEYGPAPKVLEALAACPWRVLAYVPGCSSVNRARFSSDKLVISTEPIEMAEVCSTAAAVVCHAGSGTAMTALHAGKPLVLLPMHVEQFLQGRRVQAFGAGLVLMEERIDALPAALRRVVEQASFREAAEAFARRYASPGGNHVAETVAARCQELALETRGAARPGATGGLGRSLHGAGAP
jgi:hypothetical protein